MDKKQKALFSFVIVIMTMLTIGCSIDTDETINHNDQITVDSRLYAESGHWTSNWREYDVPGRLIFTKNSLIVVRSNIEDNPIFIYTKNNKVYRSDNDKLILSYAILSSDDYLWEQWEIREEWANSDYTMPEWAQMGNILRFTFPLDYNSYVYRLLRSW
jgi:hypothetical protein